MIKISNSDDAEHMKQQLAELVKDEPFVIPNLANASAFIMDTYIDLNWAGFYLLHDDTLILGPFQGKPACIRIELGKGVCGQSAKLDKTLNIPNVHEFTGHIACDSASNSEIVIPIHYNNEVIGVLDIERKIFSRFTSEDKKQIEDMVKILEELVYKT